MRALTWQYHGGARSDGITVKAESSRIVKDDTEVAVRSFRVFSVLTNTIMVLLL